MTASVARRETRIKATAWTVLALPLVVVLVFAGIRIMTDVPLLRAGVPAPAGSFDARYVAHPVLAYLHIVPGVVFLLGGVLQLNRRFRERHWTVHRRLGRVLVACAAVSGVFALAFGIPYPWGNAWEVAATVVFGAWFLWTLIAGFAAIRRGDSRQHRRWMIRAFAVALGVGSIRLWIGLLSGATSLMTFPGAFGVSFWLGLGSHAVAAELWLRWRPLGSLEPQTTTA